ncbi:acyl-CoA dehydrogenase family protein [Acrocarpospora catenulata]|uniref:acyl-CoA dehydrogenase family protein n=1 Tax=Acrocarpospora catenulata TaxID=2836182 RepID=UPI001BD94E5A|nr:acyl-CoA dehydrogenase family protein [Acrocarpospora catenulata]
MGAVDSALRGNEPGAPGSDPLLITTRARRQADGTWTVHGGKWFVSGAGSADLAFVLARTSDDRLADLQLVQRMVFEALLAIRSCRPLVFDTITRYDTGEDVSMEIGLAKVAAARMLNQVTDAAMQVYGAAGFGPDTPLPHLFRSGRTARILDGPDELHVSSVARRILR